MPIAHLTLILIILPCLLAVLVLKIIQYSGDSLTPKDLLSQLKEEPETAVTLTESSESFSQHGGTINDASGLNRTPIHGIVSIKTEQDIKDALQYARTYNLKVSIAGTRHSMGGQAFAKGGLILDMRQFKKMSVDPVRKILTVQSGAIWHEVQHYLHPFNLAVKSMQSITVISVGGTISANAHGMDHRVGSIAETIHSIRVMLADGSIKEASRYKETALFRAIIGGYGLLGVILDAQIEVTENELYFEERPIMDYRDFPAYYQQIVPNSDYRLLFARLSTAPSTFLQEMMVYAYKKSEEPITLFPELIPESFVSLSRFLFNLGKANRFGQEVKWWAEKYLLPHFSSFPASRNQIMHRPLALIRNRLRKETDILQEYYVPMDKLTEFIDKLRRVLLKGRIVTRNVEIRVIHASEALLDSAQGDRFALVLYINLPGTAEAYRRVATAHKELISIAQGLGGSFYLTYQLNATKEEVLHSYPKWSSFLSLKKEFDPHALFTNSLFDTYGTPSLTRRQALSGPATP